MRTALVLALFGSFGILLRYGLDSALTEPNKEFPISTLLINVVGSALAGAIFAFGANGKISSELQTLLLVGFCGGFTTFSAYALQTMTMLDRGRMGVAALYFIGSPLLGLLAAFAAMIAVRSLLH